MKPEGRKNKIIQRRLKINPNNNQIKGAWVPNGNQATAKTVLKLELRFWTNTLKAHVTSAGFQRQFLGYLLSEWHYILGGHCTVTFTVTFLSLGGWVT